MYSLISDIATFGTGTIVEITVADETPEGLLVNFLNELIYRFEVDGFVARTVTISSITEWSLNAILQGEAFDPEHHEQRLLLKAATYHNILVKRTGQGCMVEVLFDI
jgi:SHS2 domain-containing protein